MQCALNTMVVLHLLSRCLQARVDSRTSLSFYTMSTSSSYHHKKATEVRPFHREDSPKTRCQSENCIRSRVSVQGTCNREYPLWNKVEIVSEHVCSRCHTYLESEQLWSWN